MTQRSAACICRYVEPWATSYLSWREQALEEMKEMDRKGFTFIELLVVIAII